MAKSREKKYLSKNKAQAQKPPSYFTVEVTHWVNGELVVDYYYFNSAAEAKDFVDVLSKEEPGKALVKIYNPQGQVILTQYIDNKYGPYV